MDRISKGEMCNPQFVSFRKVRTSFDVIRPGVHDAGRSLNARGTRLIGGTGFYHEADGVGGDDSSYSYAATGTGSYSRS